MLVLFLTCLLAALSLLSTTAGVVYYVKPTEPCANNGSCPSNETCHTMDYYASNSSHYFSPEHINVTLYFMCGVHNCIQEVGINDLQTFTMTGTTSKQNVIINMPTPTEAAITTQGRDSKHFYTFTNVSNVIATNISINCVSVSFEGKDFNATDTNFYGYANFTSPYVSVITITGSSALFDNCTFQENSFLHYQSNAVITIHDCIFHSYNHVANSAIRGMNSTLNLSGSVRFINNSLGSPTSNSKVCGAAIYLAYSAESHDHFYIPRSILNINNEASVHFVNNTADCGGAIYLNNTAMNIGNQANVTFCQNKARKVHHVLLNSIFVGGSALLDNSSISTGVNAQLLFYSNTAVHDGGALFLYLSEIRLHSNTVVKFTSNTAATYGGALCLVRSTIYITGNTSVYFLNNIVTKKGGGGALSFDYSQLVIQKSVLFIGNNSAISFVGASIFTISSFINISEYSEVKLFNNLAHTQGGAIYMSLGGYLSIDSHSILTFINNSASQGGALYLPESATVNIGNNYFIYQQYSFKSWRSCVHQCSV